MSPLRVRASACALAALAAVCACAGGARRLVPAEPVTLRIGTFLPTIPSQDPVSLMAGLLSAEALVSIGWDGRPVYRLAESGQRSEDGRTLTFTLRPNLRFHNGEPVTAGRVRELLLAELGKQPEVTSLEAPDDRTLEVHLTRAYSIDLEELGHYAVSDSKRPELRTGPFKVVSTAHPARLEAFEAYYQGAPTVERVEIHRYPTHRAAWTAMMRGDVNVLHEVSREAIDFVEAGGQIKAYRLLRPYYVPLVFNVTHPVLQRRDVRVALNEAIDKREVVRNGMRGHGEVAEGPFWPHHWAHPQGGMDPAYNPEAAKVRLDAAGLPVRDREAPQMPSRFSFTCLLLAGDTRFERIALVLQRQLFAIGVDMRLEAVPFRDILKRLMSGDFEAFLFEIISGRTLDRPYMFWRSPEPGTSPLLRTGYSAADEALDRMKYAATDDEARVAVADVMRVLRADPPAVFLAWPREARAADASLDIPYETDRDIFGWLWQLAPRAADAP